MPRAKCHYCGTEAAVCCEEKIPGDDRKRTCPRAVCGKHATFVDGLWKCLGHTLPADDKKPWEN